MDTPDPKEPFKSLTINASLGALVISVAQLLGFDLGPDAPRHLDAILTGLLAAASIYGRIRATRRIVLTKPD